MLKFKLNGIDVSGGSSPKRHILQTVDFKLVKFLNYLYANDSSTPEQIYKGLYSEILSSSIPLD